MKIAECSSKSPDRNIYLETEVYFFQLYKQIYIREWIRMYTFLTVIIEFEKWCAILGWRASVGGMGDVLA